MHDFIAKLPKTELHLHIEGTLEPEMMFVLAERNKINLPFNSIEEVKKAYHFHNLQSFLDLYDAGSNVLITEQDFYDLTLAYFKRIQKQNVLHVELFFDPQTHTTRGISFATVLNGIKQACLEAKNQWGISSHIIMCFLRHLSEQSAFQTLEQAMPFQEHIIAVGLDSGEKNNPPKKFQRVFAKARESGFLTVAHAGEEGPADYIWQAINLLNVKRIDHGVHCTEDEKLIDYLAEKQIPLTICPLSNIKLCVYKTMKQHSFKQLLDRGLCVTINSDDPAYFGGYLQENYIAVCEAFGLNHQDLIQIAKNGITASFLSDGDKQNLLKNFELFKNKNNDKLISPN